MVKQTPSDAEEKLNLMKQQQEADLGLGLQKASKPPKQRLELEPITAIGKQHYLHYIQITAEVD